MAHFARVAEGVVIDIQVVNNKVIEDEIDGSESELLGQVFLSDLFGGEPSDWVQCSYNGSRRGLYPGIGYTWDGENFAAPEVNS